jgi:glycosyltransferase involved in cell wall biosynthesis
MRVLLVSHLFPPAHRAGTEVYTAEVGARLAARGHEVTVLTTDKDVGREDLSLVEREHRGLRVLELTNNLYLEAFEQTWERPEIARRFGALCAELAPDVVHFQHLLYLSSGCLEAAARGGAAVLFTLHDFWLACPRMGQLVHADGSLCHEVDHARCGTCLPSFKWRQSDVERRAGRALGKLHAWTGLDLAPLARGAARRLAGRQPAPAFAPPDDAVAARYAGLARARADELRVRATRHVARFLSPSAFLARRMVAWGLPAERVFEHPTGVDVAPAPRAARTAGARLRVTFLGTFVPLKGAHVLLDAWAALDEAQRARGELALYGPDDHAPDYVAGLRARAAAVGARLEPALDREGVARELARTDLLVVPSVWFENRPLVILEARAAGVPLLVSDLGGMAELVQDGVQGWRFPAGDSAALAARLGALLDDRAPLAALAAGADDLTTWDACVDALLAHYDAVRGGGGA